MIDLINRFHYYYKTKDSFTIKCDWQVSGNNLKTRGELLST